jgi:hypothetical protein
LIPEECKPGAGHADQHVEAAVFELLQKLCGLLGALDGAFGDRGRNKGNAAGAENQSFHLPGAAAFQAQHTKTGKRHGANRRGPFSMAQLGAVAADQRG